MFYGVLLVSATFFDTSRCLVDTSKSTCKCTNKDISLSNKQLVNVRHRPIVWHLPYKLSQALTPTRNISQTTQSIKIPPNTLQRKTSRDRTNQQASTEPCVAFRRPCAPLKAANTPGTPSWHTVAGQAWIPRTLFTPTFSSMGNPGKVRPSAGLQWPAAESWFRSLRCSTTIVRITCWAYLDGVSEFLSVSG